MDDLRDFLSTAPKRVIRETFGSGDTAFEVELRLCSRADLDSMRKKATKKVLDRTTRQFRDEVDVERLREYLRDQCILNWTELTFAKVAQLCNRAAPDAAVAKTAIPASSNNKQALLDEALGFEDWVWERVTSLAEEAEHIAAGEGRTSASTPAATSVT